MSDTATPTTEAIPPVRDPAKAHAGTAFKHERQLTRARFSPDGKLIAAAGLDKLIHVWELESGAKHTLPGHTTWISAMVFESKSARLFTADFHGTIHCWDPAKPDAKPLFTIHGADAKITRSLAISADGATLFSGGDDCVVRLWSTADGGRRGELGRHQGCIFSIAAHPDGKTIVSGDLFGAVKVWDIASAKCVREFDAKLLHTRKEDFLADVGGVRCIAFDAAGGRMAVGGLSAAESNTFCPGIPTALLFDWKTGRQTQQLKLAAKADGTIDALRFLEDGILVGIGENQGGTQTELALWNGDAPEPFHSVKCQSGYDLDVHPDGLRIVAPLFVSMGSGGNGARSKHKESYLPNAALVQVFNLFAAPPPPPKRGRKA